MPHTVVPVVFFAFLAVVLLVPSWLNHRSREAALRIIAESVEKGRPLDPQIIDRMLAKPWPNVGKGFALLNLVLGVLHLCVGIALAVAAHLPPGTPGLMTGALVNLCIGPGLIALGVVAWRAFARSGRSSRKWNYAGVLALVCLYFGVVGLCVGAGLALAASIYPHDMDSRGVARFIGALVNLSYGAGLTLLGIIVLRLSRGEEAGR
jgi:hypothetical protein